MSEILILQVSKEDLQSLIQIAVVIALKDLREEMGISKEQYLTRKEVAEMFQVTLTTINQWSRTGKIKRHYIASRVYYLQSELVGMFKHKQKNKS